MANTTERKVLLLVLVCAGLLVLLIMGLVFTMPVDGTTICLVFPLRFTLWVLFWGFLIGFILGVRRRKAGGAIVLLALTGPIGALLALTLPLEADHGPAQPQTDKVSQR